jgi:hypothetical protein
MLFHRIFGMTRGPVSPWTPGEPETPSGQEGINRKRFMRRNINFEICLVIKNVVSYNYRKSG